MPVRRAAGLAAGGRGIEETRTRRAVTATRERLATRKSRCRKHPENSYMYPNDVRHATVRNTEFVKQLSLILRARTNGCTRTSHAQFLPACALIARSRPRRILELRCDDPRWTMASARLADTLAC
jgi:hypothetical protein